MKTADEYDVVIVGGGPAGIAAACELRDRGVRDLLLIEREADLGGVPRHCDHRAFGVAEFGRLLRGPDYARRLTAALRGVDVMCRTSVVSIHPQGVLEVRSPGGMRRICGRYVLLATGTRETPRSARLVSGTRPWGVMTTGALQQFVHLKHFRPFRQPVIVGSELVAYSALLTLRHAGARAAAMIESASCATAFPRLGRIAAAAFGTRLLTGTELVAIEGQAKVTGVQIARQGRRERLACDGVIFSGEFVPESALVRGSHLDLDPGTGGPAVDQYGRCSDSVYFAAGNVLRPVEPAWRAWREGRIVAGAMARALRGELPTLAPSAAISAAAPLQYACPQRYVAAATDLPPLPLHVRPLCAARGMLRVFVDEREIWRQRVALGRLRRLEIPVPPQSVRGSRVEIRIEED